MSKQPAIIAMAPPPRPVPASSSSDSNPSAPPSPFTTTSDVLRQLNAALDRLDDEGEADADRRSSSREREDSDATASASGDVPTASSSRSRPNAPKFELQRRFEDGSTRTATEAELKSRDFEGKLKQTALHLQELSSPQEREDFVQGQIEYGNRLYASRQYEDAMDVYLTCLAGVDMSRSSRNSNRANDEGNSNSSTDSGRRPYDGTGGGSTEEEEEEEEGGGGTVGVRAVLLVRILHNLALSALQLGWHGKCLRFSSLGLQALGLSVSSSKCSGGRDGGDDGEENETTRLLGGVAKADDVPAARTLYAAKLHHLHAKASRLTGRYIDAQHNLSEALRWVHDDNISNSKDDGGDMNRNAAATTEAQVAAVRKEQRLLRDAMQHGRDNRLRQRAAMQKILAPPGSSVARDATGSSPADDSRPSTRSMPTPLYDDEKAKDTSGGAGRQYSRLRSPSYYAAPRRRRTGVVDLDASDDGHCVNEHSPTTDTTRRRRNDRCCQRIFSMLRSWVEDPDETARNRARNKA